jgi:hypothetical protein
MFQAEHAASFNDGASALLFWKLAMATPPASDSY